jgi:hypothetical protein
MMSSPSAPFLGEGHAGLKTGFHAALQHNPGAMHSLHGFTSASGRIRISMLFQLFVDDPPAVRVQILTVCAKFCRSPSCEIHVALPYAPLRGSDALHALLGRFLPRLGPLGNPEAALFFILGLAMRVSVPACCTDMKPAG